VFGAGSRAAGNFMPYLYLIRHPRTHVDPTRATAEWNLSDEGYSQVEALADAPFWHSVSALYSSTQPKATRAASAIAVQHNIRLTLSPDLVEVQRGSDVFRSLNDHHTQLRQFFLNPHEHISGWETAATALARFQNAVTEIRELYAGRSVAILSHGTVLTLFTAMLDGEVPTLERWQAIGFAAVATVDMKTNKIIQPFTTDAYDSVPMRSSG
jgi:broad specificity phosphatase PhoE